MTSATITLYTTWGCHLCEQAQALLQQAGIIEQLQLVDIVDDEHAFERYRLHIPVVVKNSRELYWPFDLASLDTWLKEEK